MNISLPREKALEDEDLDLHILVSAMSSDSNTALIPKATTSKVEVPIVSVVSVDD